MISAPLPANESERLAELERLQLLDSLPEPVYDEIVGLASRLCGTPIALVSLIAQDRQWFKARVGLEAEQTPREQAFCAHALLTPGDLMEVPDARRDPRFAGNPLVTGAPHIGFYAGVPLVTSHGHALGTLCVIDHQPRRLDAPQRDALRSLARLVEYAIEQQRQRLRAESDRLQLELATESARLGLWVLDVRSGRGEVRGAFAALLGFAEGEFDGRLESFMQRVHPDDQEMLREHQRRELELGDFSRVEFRVLHPDGSQRWLVSRSRGVHDRHGALTHVAGLLFDRTEQRELEEHLRDYQQELLDMAQRMETLAITDMLTGVGNRRALEEQLRARVAHSQRHRGALSVLLIDVDHFKAFNDQYGHLAGDRVLREVAQRIVACVRTEDVVARYGGEEFAVLLPDTDMDGAWLLGERIRQAIESHAWPLRKVTASIGVSSAAGVEAEAEILLREADEQLYRAKSSGRNLVCAPMD
jgi:diguanylate cyclase (GGDEF)-like protein/PAS domain S-box-containing protein